MCVWLLISPGRTNLPVASIWTSPAGRRALPRLSATGSSGTTSVMVFPSMTMSMGPRAGVPLPSTTVALRMTSRGGRVPCVTPRVCAPSERAAAATSAAPAAREPHHGLRSDDADRKRYAGVPSAAIRRLRGDRNLRLHRDRLDLDRYPDFVADRDAARFEHLVPGQAPLLAVDLRVHRERRALVAPGVLRGPGELPAQRHRPGGAANGQVAGDRHVGSLLVDAPGAERH